MAGENAPQMKDAVWVARRLGMTRQAVTRKARLGELPAVRIGPRYWRFEESRIEAYIEAHRSGQIAPA